MIKTHSTTEKGQSLVELSLVFTLLLLLVGGIIDLGSMFYTSLALRDTVQEGVIFGATNPLNVTEIKNRVKESASFPINSSQINVADITVTCSGGSCVSTSMDTCAGKKITVQINYIHKLIMPIIPVVVGRQTVTLNASATGTILQSGTKDCPKPQVSPTLTPIPSYP